MKPVVLQAPLGDEPPTATLYYGLDVRKSLRLLEDASVHVVCTSPPYWGLRDYGMGGQLGTEETPDKYVANLVEVFRDVARVLRPDGTLWLNLGDSYTSGGRTWRAHDAKDGKGGRASDTRAATPRGLKPKDLVGIPWRVAFALQADGWYLRSAAPWVKRNCLSGGTRVYVRSQKGDMPMTIKDIARLDPLTIKLWNGQRWTQVVNIWEVERPQDTIELELRSGERIGCTLDHRWPLAWNLEDDGPEIREARDLNIGDVLATCFLPDPEEPRRPRHLPPGDVGWFVGLYIAEGSRSGRCIQFAGHTKELDRLRGLERIAKAFGGTCRSHLKGGKSATINLYGEVLNGILDQYVSGKGAKNKHLAPRCWQRDERFLRAVLDGYLSGDGGHDEENRRWRLGFCDNDNLAYDLRTLCARTHVYLRLKRATHHLGDREFPGWRGQIRFDKNDRRVNSGGFPMKEEGEILAIRRSRARKFYDIQVEDDPHLFALASGVLTHNSMPESVRDRPVSGIEYVFLFAHPESGGRYFYDPDAIRVAGAMKPQRRSRGNPRRTPRKPEATFVTTEGRSELAPDFAFRARRNTDWFFESLENIAGGGQDVLLNAEGDPLAFAMQTKPYPGAHFAVWPSDLVEPMVRSSTSAKGVCGACGAPWTRVVGVTSPEETGAVIGGDPDRNDGGSRTKDLSGAGGNSLATRRVGTEDWTPSCTCEAEVARATVLDLFSGSATTGMVALAEGRHYIGFDLNADYLPLAEARILGRRASREGGKEDEGETTLDMFGV